MVMEEAANRLLKQVLKIWVYPEIERQIKRGRLQQPFSLYAVQIISFTDGRENIIRLNEEVKGLISGIASTTIRRNRIRRWATLWL
jgi:hypothetical protein